MIAYPKYARLKTLVEGYVARGLRVKFEENFIRDVTPSLKHLYENLVQDLRAGGFFVAFQREIDELRFLNELPGRKKTLINDFLSTTLRPYIINIIRSDDIRVLQRHCARWNRRLFDLGAVTALGLMGYKAGSKKIDYFLKKYLREKTVGRVIASKAAGDEIVFELTDEEMLTALDARSREFGKLASDEMMGSTRRVLRDEVYAKGRSTWDVGRELASGEGVIEWQARKLVRTEASQVFNLSMFTSYQRSNIVKHTWVTVGDNRVREQHEANDGVTVLLGEEFPSGQVHPADGPLSVNCRCSTLPEIGDDTIIRPWDGSADAFVQNWNVSRRVTRGLSRHVALLRDRIQRKFGASVLFRGYDDDYNTLAKELRFVERELDKVKTLVPKDLELGDSTIILHNSDEVLGTSRGKWLESERRLHVAMRGKRHTTVLTPGDFTVDNSVAGTLRHEYSHVLFTTLRKRVKGFQKEWDNYFKVLEKSDSIGAISLYAKKSPSEMFAESVSVFTSGKYKKGILPKRLEEILTEGFKTRTFRRVLAPRVSLTPDFKRSPGFSIITKFDQQKLGGAKWYNKLSDNQQKKVLQLVDHGADPSSIGRALRYESKDTLLKRYSESEADELLKFRKEFLGGKPITAHLPSKPGHEFIPLGGKPAKGSAVVVETDDLNSVREAIHSRVEALGYSEHSTQALLEQMNAPLMQKFVDEDYAGFFTLGEKESKQLFKSKYGIQFKKKLTGNLPSLGKLPESVHTSALPAKIRQLRIDAEDAAYDAFKGAFTVDEHEAIGKYVATRFSEEDASAIIGKMKSLNKSTGVNKSEFVRYMKTRYGVNLSRPEWYKKPPKIPGAKPAPVKVPETIKPVEATPPEPKVSGKPLKEFDLDHDDLENVDWGKMPGWDTSDPKSYGGAIFDDDGRILLREPTNHYHGYHWTFPKGGVEPGDTIVKTALKEVAEETGHRGQIIGAIDDGFIAEEHAGHSRVHMFMMRSKGYDKNLMDWETSSVRWATYDEAKALIKESTYGAGRNRDLKILDAAFAQYNKLKQGAQNPALEKLLGKSPVAAKAHKAPVAFNKNQVRVELEDLLYDELKMVHDNEPFVGYVMGKLPEDEITNVLNKVKGLKGTPLERKSELVSFMKNRYGVNILDEGWTAKPPKLPSPKLPEPPSKLIIVDDLFDDVAEKIEKPQFVHIGDTSLEPYTASKDVLEHIFPIIDDSNSFGNVVFTLGKATKESGEALGKSLLNAKTLDELVDVLIDAGVPISTDTKLKLLAAKKHKSKLVVTTWKKGEGLDTVGAKLSDSVDVAIDYVDSLLPPGVNSQEFLDQVRFSLMEADVPSGAGLLKQVHKLTDIDDLRYFVKISNIPLPNSVMKQLDEGFSTIASTSEAISVNALDNIPHWSKAAPDEDTFTMVSSLEDKEALARVRKKASEYFPQHATFIDNHMGILVGGADSTTGKQLVKILDNVTTPEDFAKVIRVSGMYDQIPPILQADIDELVPPSLFTPKLKAPSQYLEETVPTWSKHPDSASSFGKTAGEVQMQALGEVSAKVKELLPDNQFNITEKSWYAIQIKHGIKASSKATGMKLGGLLSEAKDLEHLQYILKKSGMFDDMMKGASEFHWGIATKIDTLIGNSPKKKLPQWQMHLGDQTFGKATIGVESPELDAWKNARGVIGKFLEEGEDAGAFFDSYEYMIGIRKALHECNPQLGKKLCETLADVKTLDELHDVVWKTKLHKFFYTENKDMGKKFVQMMEAKYPRTKPPIVEWKGVPKSRRIFYETAEDADIVDVAIPGVKELVRKWMAVDPDGLWSNLSEMSYVKGVERALLHTNPTRAKQLVKVLNEANNLEEVADIVVKSKMYKGFETSWDKSFARKVHADLKYRDRIPSFTLGEEPTAAVFIDDVEKAVSKVYTLWPDTIAEATELRIEVRKLLRRSANDDTANTLVKLLQEAESPQDIALVLDTSGLGSHLEVASETFKKFVDTPGGGVFHMAGPLDDIPQFVKKSGSVGSDLIIKLEDTLLETAYIWDSGGYTAPTIVIKKVLDGASDEFVKKFTVNLSKAKTPEQVALLLKRSGVYTEMITAKDYSSAMQLMIKEIDEITPSELVRIPKPKLPKVKWDISPDDTFGVNIDDELGSISIEMDGNLTSLGVDPEVKGLISNAVFQSDVEDGTTIASAISQVETQDELRDLLKRVGIVRFADESNLVAYWEKLPFDNFMSKVKASPVETPAGIPVPTSNFQLKYNVSWKKPSGSKLKDTIDVSTDLQYSNAKHSLEHLGFSTYDKNQILESAISTSPAKGSRLLEMLGDANTSEEIAYIVKQTGMDASDYFSAETLNKINSLYSPQANAPVHTSALKPLSASEITPDLSIETLTKTEVDNIVREALSSGDFPSDVNDLVFVRELSGYTKPKEMVDSRTGIHYVVKKGSNAKHIREEFICERLYRAAGVDVPESALVDTPDGPIKITRFLQGEELGEYTRTARGVDAMHAQSRATDGFAADCLFANWDVAGNRGDNLFVVGERIYRIDAGGGLRYKGIGVINPNKFGDVVDEIDNLRNPSVNATTAKYYGQISDYEIIKQVESLYGRKDAILKVAPDEIRGTLENRLEYMKNWAAEKKAAWAKNPPKFGFARRHNNTDLRSKSVPLDNKIQGRTLTYDEKEAITAYTRESPNMYEPTNEALREDKPLSYDLKQMTLGMDQGLAKLEPVPGYHTRGIWLYGEEFEKAERMYQPGNVVRWTQFNSASVDLEFGSSRNVRFFIQGKTARDIRPISHFGSAEGEVMYGRGTTLIVDRVEKRPDKDKLYIYMTEILTE